MAGLRKKPEKQSEQSETAALVQVSQLEGQAKGEEKSTFAERAF